MVAEPDDTTGAPVPARHDLDARVMAATLAQRMFGDEHRASIQIGRFLVLDRIGGGGMGTVFRAYDPELDRSVAVKVLRPDIARDDPSSARRMQREALGLARLSHPNVVTIHEVGTIDGQTFLAMEYVQGIDLARWMQSHPIGSASRFAAAMDLLLQSSRGLAAAHSAGLVHRDFKPSNVLVGADGRVRVADFGLVRDAAERNSAAESQARTLASVETRSAGESTVTQAGALVGTLRYMAPEQQCGRVVDARSDQFSFCVTAWELLFGCLPWPDGASDDPPELPDDAPRWVAAVLARGLHFDPAARYPDMPALAAALARDPRRRRRLWAASIGTLAAIGAGAATLVHHRSTMCDGGAEELASHWNDERRAALAQTFADSGVPTAADTWQRTDARLQHFADEWLATRDSVCDAGLRRRAIAVERYQAATGCLDVRLVELEAGLLVLEQATTQAMSNATYIAYGLPSPSDCDSSRVRNTMVLPSDVERASAVLEAMQEVNVSRLEIVADEFQDALTRVEALEPTIAALDYLPLSLRARDVRMLANDALGRLDEATAIATDAYWTALRNGEDAMAATFARRLAEYASQRSDSDAADD
ncbi:MAG TPA: serine/threonine-protein kinase, partial [Nannocystaceae bacterium]|nr:serine/threonine-protein kinase [Nannocystaceae bacterium]